MGIMLSSLLWVVQDFFKGFGSRAWGLGNLNCNMLHVF